MVVIAAVSDIHSPRFLDQFLASMGIRMNQAELMLWAGDMVWRGRISTLDSVLKGVRKVYNGRIIAVFGNEEHDDLKPRFIKNYPEITWLDDSEIDLEIAGRKMRIVGTKGSLGEPTTWQEKNIPNIQEIYANRIQKVRWMLSKRESGVINLFLTHYSPSSLTIAGESPALYPVLMDERMETVVRETKPDFVVHGHSHNSRVLYSEVEGIRVFNVAFPARKRITMIDI